MGLFAWFRWLIGTSTTSTSTTPQYYASYGDRPPLIHTDDRQRESLEFLQFPEASDLKDHLRRHMNMTEQAFHMTIETITPNFRIDVGAALSSRVDQYLGFVWNFFIRRWEATLEERPEADFTYIGLPACLNTFIVYPPPPPEEAEAQKVMGGRKKFARLHLMHVLDIIPRFYMPNSHPWHALTKNMWQLLTFSSDSLKCPPRVRGVRSTELRPVWTYPWSWGSRTPRTFIHNPFETWALPETITVVPETPEPAPREPGTHLVYRTIYLSDFLVHFLLYTEWIGYPECQLHQGMAPLLKDSFVFADAVARAKLLYQRKPGHDVFLDPPKGGHHWTNFLMITRYIVPMDLHPSQFTSSLHYLLALLPYRRGTLVWSETDVFNEPEDL